MYSSKGNVNILTALLAAHGIRHAVVCPGSRNAPLIHNLNECPDITCYPVTDERSAGFFALGIAQATDQPVVVCVTSGTAVLNVAPAVAEAFYQHQSLIVISADRPAQWIGQLDGQTIWQPGVLAPWVSRTVTLPEADAWHCNRLANEALLEATADHHPCVHINVPITEPLFQFTCPALPGERVIRRYAPAVDYDCLPQQLIDDLQQACRPLIVFGQLSPRRFHYESVSYLFSHVIVLHEALAPFTTISHFEEVLDNPQLLPDFILYVGDGIVSKRLKAFLRQAKEARTWRISLTGEVEDTFQNLRGIITGDAERILQSLDNKLSRPYDGRPASQTEYRRLWLHHLKEAKGSIEATVPPFSEAAAVRLFEQGLQTVGYDYEVHYANSTAIRLANRYVQGHPVWCNRGTNGIEGSLSTAAGFSVAMTVLHPSQPPMVFCVIGDLSFFYDQNALWNRNLQANLRILLLNNGHGAIFDQLPGLERSPAHQDLVAGQHAATAEGCCRQHNIVYLKARDMEELNQGITALLAPPSQQPNLSPDESQRPLLLEVLLTQHAVH